MKFRMVKVDWLDSMGGSNWEHLAGRRPTTPAKVETVGWLVTDEEDFIEVALSWAEADTDKEQIGHILAIPRVVISSITDVGTVVKKR